MQSVLDQQRKGKDSVSHHDKGTDCEPIELLKKCEVEEAFLHESLFRVQNEKHSKDEAEEQDVAVDQVNSRPAMDDEAAEEPPVLRVGVKHHDPVDCQEGEGGGQAWGEHFEVHDTPQIIVSNPTLKIASKRLVLNPIA
jgi:hypothetical protein